MYLGDAAKLTLIVWSSGRSQGNAKAFLGEENHADEKEKVRQVGECNTIDWDWRYYAMQLSLLGGMKIMAVDWSEESGEGRLPA